MIPKEEREKDKAVLAARSPGQWWREDCFVLLPDGKSAFDGRGHHQEILNAAATVTAVNQIDAYIADAEEMELRIAKIEDELESFKRAVKDAAIDGTYGYDTSDSQRRYEAKVEALTGVLHILRGGQ